MYNKTVVARFKNPTHAGNVKKAEALAEIVSSVCNDVVKMGFRVDENERIVDAKFKAFGSVATIAAADVACELVIGKTLQEAKEITNKDIFEVLGELPAHKIYATNFAEDAIKTACDEYYERIAKEEKRLRRKQAREEASDAD